MWIKKRTVEICDPKNYKGKIILYQTEKIMIYGSKYHLQIKKFAKDKI